MPHATADMEVSTPTSQDTPTTSQATNNDDDDIDLPDAPEPTTTKAAPPSTDKVALEDIFNDDVSDSELLTSTADTLSSPPTQNTTTTTVTTSSPPQPSTLSGHDAPTPTIPSTTTTPHSDPTLLLQYYTRLFPFRPLFLWLNHSPTPTPHFANREFAFTLPNSAYLRYQSYPTPDLLRRDILRLNPSRFEIGPEYTTNPRDRKTLRKQSTFRPLSKELVFDIDLTDYDDIRTCCIKAEICKLCWKFATMALKVIDVALRDDFGFQHILWVYSGRRGIHAWISDREARCLDDDQRRALVAYFEVLRGGAGGAKKVNLKRPLHPHIRRSLDILTPYFFEVLSDQDPWRSHEGEEVLLNLLPDATLTAALRRKWSSSPDRPSRKKWDDIDELARSGASPSLDTARLLEAKQDIRLEYTYPRIDVEVGKKRIHLLKSPFVVHPGTGRVCVPITTGGDWGRAEAFDPVGVPRVGELLGDIDAWRGNGGEETGDGEGTGMGSQKKVQDWEKTGLKPYYSLFADYVNRLVKSEGVSLKRERDEEGRTGADGMEF